MIAKYLLWSFLSRVRAEEPQHQYNEIKSIINRGELLVRQENYLKSLLLHAYRQVPYYNKIFTEISLVKNNEVDLSQFSKIPILTKEIIRNYHQELISRDCVTRKWYYNSSGGSTGEPIRFIQDDLYGRWGNATNKYYYQDILAINQLKAKEAILWGSERELFEGSIGLKARISHWLTNTVFLNSFRMTEGDMERYINIIKRYKPDLIRGYAGSLYELCCYAARKNLSIYTPKIVVGEAETITNEMRTQIESVFGTKLYGVYGSRECGHMADECRNGLMHMLTFNNHIEILDDYNHPVKEKEEGKVIVTNLHNYSMPFIRYDIGDMAVVWPNECKCGNPLPTLRKITGRITDGFILENGTTVPAEYFIHLIGVVCNKGFIRKFQVIQEDYKRVRILVIPERIIEEPEKKDIEDKIKLVMGEDCQIIWEFVDEIPKTQSGKYLYTKSLVHR